ncbi:hypothetical protein LCGC14_1562910 [marine sediment metagenome]|uniref:Uncharacterized protein n=1 Tax=marine sediment metagenome TaxID=412755 RepID=A0A0F9ILY5_9ZZZZ
MDKETTSQEKVEIEVKNNGDTTEVLEFDSAFTEKSEEN